VRGYKPAEIGNSLPKRVPQRKIELTQGFKAEGIVANFNILLRCIFVLEGGQGPGLGRIDREQLHDSFHVR
jgi:hypothetical protein